MAIRPRRAPRGWGVGDVPDLTGRTIVVTGATSGIGLEATRVFAAQGANTVIAARNELKAAEAIRTIRDDHPDAAVEFRHLDVGDLPSVRSFAAEAADLGPIDVLVNNAGIMLVPWGRTVDGYEMHLGTNHLGHFALTGLLLDQLAAADAARVVTVSSIAHRDGSLDPDAIERDDATGYRPMTAYRRSKLANLLFAFELQRRLANAESTTSSIAVHPGVSDTNLAHHLADRWWWRLSRPAVSLLVQSAGAGALPILRAATDPLVEGGRYLGPTGRGEISGPPGNAIASATAQDPVLARRLWDVSEQLTGVQYR